MSQDIESEFGRRGPIVDRLALSTTYALILLTVPTFGVAALVGLASVLWGTKPTDALGLSHYEYQKRTLFIAIGSIVLGGILVALSIGVLVLFVMLVWTLWRGGRGLRALQLGQSIQDPRGLF